MNVYELYTPSFIGNVGKAETIQRKDGSGSFFKFSVAINKGVGESKVTHWISCTTDKPQPLCKGQKVLVHGEIYTSVYNGEEQFNCRALNVEKLDVQTFVQVSKPKAKEASSVQQLIDEDSVPF